MEIESTDSSLPWFLTCTNPQEIYTQGSALILDYETDTEQFGSALIESNDIVLACWQLVGPDGTTSAVKHCFGGEFEQQELMDDIAAVDFVVAQNVKMEAQWLKRSGLELRDVLFYDTLLAAWVIDGNRRRARDLESLAKRYGVPGKKDVVSSLIKLGVPTRDIHPGWLLEYCHADVEATKQVFLKQREELTARKQWHLAHTRNLCAAVLSDIEFEGLTLDSERVMEEHTKASKIKEELGAQLAEITGGINLGSPKQLANFLYNVLGIPEPTDYRGKPIRTPKDEPTANAKALALLKPKTEEQRSFLQLYKDYNKQSSLLEKNLDYFKLTCEQKEGKFYGQIKQAVVKTHRLSSSGIPIKFEGLKQEKSVQFQNIPREYKKLFWSGDEDWYVAEFDSAQLEFRVAVDMADDVVGREEIESGTDVHSFTASVLDREGDPLITSFAQFKDKRQHSKQFTFKPLYGGGKGSPAVEAYCEYFKEKYVQLSEMQRGWAEYTVNHKQFTTPYGMTFYFPTCKLQRSGYITDTTSIYNFPVQGFATGEIIPIALVYFWHRARGKPIRIFTTIHDSIGAYVKAGYEEEATQIAKQSLTSDVYEYLDRVYNYQFTVPLGFGAKISRNWSDTDEEYKLDVFPCGRQEER